MLLTASAYATTLFVRLSEDPAGWILSTFLAATLFSAGISVWAIMLFRDRVKQAGWVAKSMIFQTIALGAAAGVFFTSGPIGSALIGEAIGTGLIGLTVIFQYLARQAILKDEALVRSIDRIR